MSVTPIGNTTFINQNAPVVSQVQANNQARFDMQAALATQLAGEQEGEVKQIRPAEETYKIDPQNQHEKEKGEQEAGAFEQSSQQESQQNESYEQNEQQEDESLNEGHVLDIKI
ncbi:hypothetical protein [Campylobacter curvus]|uniref:hypothetical protein n=1 Tax=Campylobacter curvus TaxID=200 RepID=UPI0014703268|nr:hypothetical protein [Campylobacter curvus]